MLIMTDINGVDTHTVPAEYYVDLNVPPPTIGVIVGMQLKEDLDELNITMPMKWSGGAKIAEIEIIQFPLVGNNFSR